jgi:exosortase C (VPDSG-CTERM-specific)
MIPKAVGPAGASPASVRGPAETPSPAAKLAVRRRLISLAIVGGAILLAFGQALFDLIQFTLSDDLFSYIPLIPLVTAYLIWDGRRRLQLETEPARRWALVPFAAGLLLLATYWGGFCLGWDFAPSDYLALMVAALLALLIAAAVWFLGPATLRTIAFPVGFLIFAVPMPAAVRAAFEAFLQHASADVSYVFILLTGTPVIRVGLIFELPGINIEVAPECSGIHATLMLIVTSALAAYLFLRTTSRRILLVAAVLPLALLRNGFRIWVISELCVHVSPDMINSYIHRHGGPIFFVASLVPFFYWLRFLHRSESVRSPAAAPQEVQRSSRLP